MKSEKIFPTRYKQIEFQENSVIIDGKEYEIDAFVMCTGYHNSISFLDEEIKKGI